MKGARDVVGLSYLRRVRAGDGRSMPRSGAGVYLELYVRRLEEARLENEAAAVAKRGQQVERRLEELRRQITRLERVVGSPGASGQEPDADGGRGRGAARAGRWNTFTLEL